jgi:hypothetical protein
MLYPSHVSTAHLRQIEVTRRLWCIDVIRMRSEVSQLTVRSFEQENIVQTFNLALFHIRFWSKFRFRHRGDMLGISVVSSASRYACWQVAPSGDQGDRKQMSQAQSARNRHIGGFSPSPHHDGIAITL